MATKVDKKNAIRQGIIEAAIVYTVKNTFHVLSQNQHIIKDYFPICEK